MRVRYCPNQHQVLSPLAAFCPACGAALPDYLWKRCSKGHPNSDDNQFCSQCGEPLPCLVVGGEISGEVTLGQTGPLMLPPEPPALEAGPAPSPDDAGGPGGPREAAVTTPSPKMASY